MPISIVQSRRRGVIDMGNSRPAPERRLHMRAPKVCALCKVLVTTALLGAVALLRPAAGDVVRTRHAEGTAHGVLVLTNTADEPLAYGELIQWEEGRDSVASRLLIRFKDGSVYDEVVRFAQRPTRFARQGSRRRPGPVSRRQPGERPPRS